MFKDIAEKQDRRKKGGGGRGGRGGGRGGRNQRGGRSNRGGPQVTIVIMNFFLYKYLFFLVTFIFLYFFDRVNEDRTDRKMMMMKMTMKVSFTYLIDLY